MFRRFIWLQIIKKLWLVDNEVNLEIKLLENLVRILLSFAIKSVHEDITSKRSSRNVIKLSLWRERMNANYAYYVSATMLIIIKPIILSSCITVEAYSHSAVGLSGFED